MGLASLHLPLAALAAVLLDRLLGEPARFHPLVGFGRLAGWLEARLCRPQANAGRQRGAGLIAWSLAVLPPVALAMALRNGLPAWGAWLVDVALLTFTLGAHSLAAHVRPVATHLADSNLPAARAAVARVVSRETAALDPEGVARAAVETTLENGSDAVFGALFWFAVGGGPAALLFRLANTLDAMWGYRTPRFVHFGWAAARLDDGLGYLPARLCALTYAVLGNVHQALACWRTQAPAWDSPNAGPVMAAGAGSLGVRLGGAAVYHGRNETRPPLGDGPPATAADIGRALTLVDRGVVLWLAASFALTIAGGLGHA